MISAEFILVRRHEILTSFFAGHTESDEKYNYIIFEFE